jgi:hypothetical protein
MAFAPAASTGATPPRCPPTWPRRPVGTRRGLRIWRADRPRTARAGLQHVARRRRQPDPRAAQRAHLRVPGRRPCAGRNAGRRLIRAPSRSTSSATSSTTPSTTRRADATRSTSTSASGPRARATCWPSRSASPGPSGGGHVLLQPRQRRLCLREQIPAHRRAEEGLAVSPASFFPTGAERTAPRRPRPRGSTTRSRAASSLSDRYKAAVEAGTIPPSAELDEHVHRILRSMFAAGRDRLSAPAQRRRSLCRP